MSNTYQEIGDDDIIALIEDICASDAEESSQLYRFIARAIEARAEDLEEGPGLPNAARLKSGLKKAAASMYELAGEMGRIAADLFVDRVSPAGAAPSERQQA